jgi:hypothetical protein
VKRGRVGVGAATSQRSASGADAVLCRLPIVYEGVRFLRARERSKVHVPLRSGPLPSLEAPWGWAGVDRHNRPTDQRSKLGMGLRRGSGAGFLSLAAAAPLAVRR